jgi:transposase InsO family protein
MRHHGLRAKTVLKWRPTTQSAHPFPVASNQLNRQFAVAAPNQVWAGDLTYIRTVEGWLYLAVLLDLYSRAVIGWAIGSRLTGELTQQALVMVLNRRHPKPGLLHHSDRGSQYAATAYPQHLRAAGMIGSMSRRGNCGEQRLRGELLRHVETGTDSSSPVPDTGGATQDIFEYLEVFYKSAAPPLDPRLSVPG